MLMIDLDKSHIMRSHVRENEYLTLAWPKDLLLRDLEYCREIVNLQLGVFIKNARIKTKKEEAADAEYSSWFQEAK